MRFQPASGEIIMSKKVELSACCRSKDAEIVRLTKVIKDLRNKVGVRNNAYDVRDIEDLDSEAAFVRKEGFTRISPQSFSVAEFMCDKCKTAFTSEIAINRHVKKLEESCNICSKIFQDKNDLTRHKRSAHITRAQLNCNECDIQANSEPELKKHLNLKFHKPAGGVIGSELKDSQTCNICNEECNEWWILMNHRRNVHPERRRKVEILSKANAILKIKNAGGSIQLQCLGTTNILLKL